MARPPDSTKTTLRQKLADRARERWPQLAGVTVRHHGEFAYVAGQLPDGTAQPLMRLRYTGSAAHWGFAIYRASHDDYDKSVLPTGLPFGTPQEALDCACGLYLGDATAWPSPPTPDELTGATTRKYCMECTGNRSLSRRPRDGHRPPCRRDHPRLVGVGRYTPADHRPRDPTA